MARKGENIYKRKDGRWEGRYIRGRKHRWTQSTSLMGNAGFCFDRDKNNSGETKQSKSTNRLCWLVRYYSIYYDTFRHFPYITKIKSDKNFLRHIHCGQFTIKLFVCQFLHPKLCIWKMWQENKRFYDRTRRDIPSHNSMAMCLEQSLTGCMIFNKIF